MATKSKVTDYRSKVSKVASFSEFCKCNGESLQSLPNLLPFGAEGSAGLPNLPNLPFSELWSQSNTNSVSSKSTVFSIDLLAIQQKSLDRALFLYIFIHEIRSSGVRASITVVHIQKFYKM